MKRIIITPTFRPHFPFNRDFLASFADHAIDADEVAVHFVVSKREVEDLQTIVSDFPRVQAQVHAVEDLLGMSGYALDAGDLLREVGKFAFQCIKKIYALKNLDYEQALIIDSESLLLKPTRVGDAFDDYFADPYVCFSTLDHRNQNWYGLLGDTVNRNASKLLGVPYPRMHLLEYYGWFYDKRIVADMFAALPEDLIGAVRRLGHDKSVFECVLYYTYLFKDPGRYGHRFVSVNDLLRDYLGEAAYTSYLADFGGFWEQVGIFEFVSKEVTESNLADLTRLFNDKKMRFYRSEIFNHNERVQEALIDATPITFLVSSENYRRIRERVAVCISGRPRDYRLELTYVRDFLADSTVDIFLHAWDAPDKDLILRSLQPARHEFEDLAAFRGRGELPSLAAARRRERLVPAGSEETALLASYSTWRAHELRQAHEEEHDVTYDIVVSVTETFLPLEQLATMLDRIRLSQQGFDGVLYAPASDQGVGLETHLLVGSAKTMDVAAGLWPVLPRALEGGYAQLDYLLLRHALGHNLEVRTYGANFVPLKIDKPLTVATLAEPVAAFAADAAAAVVRTIPPTAMSEWFQAKADSVEAIAEFELETPKVFRLTSAAGSSLSLDSSGRLITSDRARADLFYLIAAGDSDRSAVDLRPREHVDADPNPGAAVNLAPDGNGVLHVGSPPREETAFFLRRQGDAVSLEWRPGFWRDPASPAELQQAQRWSLVEGTEGPVLRPGGPWDAPWFMERVPDSAAEAVPLGVTLAVSTAAPTANQSTFARLTWRLYTAARVFEEGGTERLVRDTRAFARKVANAQRPATGRLSSARGLLAKLADTGGHPGRHGRARVR